MRKRLVLTAEHAEDAEGILTNKKDNSFLEKNSQHKS